MRVAVISDTHLRTATPWFEAVYARYLAPADLLIHCGDHTGYGLWAYLLQHRDCLAVAGNCDGQTLGLEIPPLVDREISGLRVAATHGWGPRPGLAARIATAFAGRYDLIFFGHSHTAEDVVHGQIRMVNPGSLSPGGSLALVDFEPGKCVVQFVGV